MTTASSKKGLLYSISIYSFIHIIDKAFGFILAPLMSHYVLPVGMGSLSLFTAILSFAIPFITFGTNGANLVAWHHNKNRFHSYFYSTLSINVIFFIIFTFALVIARDWIVRFTGFNFSIVLAIPLVAYLGSLRLNTLSYLQITEQLGSYAVVILSFTVLMFLTTIGLLILADFGFESKVWGMIVGGFFSFGVCLYILLNLKKEDTSIHNAFIKDAFFYGLPLVIHGIGQVILDISDRFFINAMVNKAELGLYSMAYTISGLLGILTTSFFSAWVPKMHGFLKQNTEPALINVVKVHFLYILGILVISIIFVFIAPLIFQLIIDESYENSLRFIPWISAVYFLQSVYLIFAGILFYYKKNNYFAFASVFNITLNIFLNYLLIGIYGTVGAAYASFISMFFFTIIIAKISDKVIRLPWRKGIIDLVTIK